MTKLLVQSSCDESRKIITSLDLLEAELVKVLYRREDPDRLVKAKSVLERYRGVDWITHQRCPTVDGFQLCGYQRVSVKKHNDLFDLLILSWAPGTRSPIHNHPCERCFLMCISGSMFEERYEKDKDGNLHKKMDTIKIKMVQLCLL